MVRTTLYLLVFGLSWLAPALGQDAEAPVPADPGVEGQLAEPSPDEQQPPPLVATGNELLARRETAFARIESLQAQADAAEGEDLRILNRQVIDAKIELLDLIHKLVKNVLAREQAALPARELRGKVEADLTRLPAAFDKHIEATAVEIGKIRAEREAADLGDQLALEHRIARRVDWLDVLYKSYAELIVDMEALGMDATEPRADLVERTMSRADRLAGRLELVAEQIARAKQRAVDAPDDASIKVEIQVLQEQRSSMGQAMSTTAGILDRLGLDSSAFRKTLIKSTGEVTTDVFRSGVLKGLIVDWFEDARQWFLANGRALAFQLIVFVLILVVSRLIAGVAKRLLVRRFRKGKSTKSALLQSMIQGLVVRVIMILGFLFALGTLGLEIGPLLAGLGIAGFIVGFALQDTLSNFASGVMILGYRPFDKGDMIEAGGVFGRVDKMSLVSTTILTIDNQTLIVPNSRIWGDVIKNVTNQTMRRVDLKFLVAHSEDVDRVERLFMSTLEEHPKVLDDPEPVVKLHALGEYAMEFVVRPWVETADYWDVRWDLVREVKRKLDAEGIAIPVPGRDVRLTQAQ